MISLKRETKETNITLELECYGTGRADIATGVGFFDHMLESLTKHSGINLTIACQGDTHVDFHHTVEDVGIVLGDALHQSLFPVAKIERFGQATVVMDEAAVECVLDISNRPFLVYEIPVDGHVGEFPCELAEEFFRALIFNSKLTAHFVLQRGKNRHHIIEGAFKAFAVALRRAIAPNERLGVPSTKGVL